MRHRAFRPLRVVLALATAAVGACGGGGGGAASPPLFMAGPVTSLGLTMPLAMTLGYFDGDAHLDLLAPGGDESAQGFVWRASVALGRADGTFEPRAPVTAGVPEPADLPRALTGHFDDGASQDVVIVAGRRYGVLLGNGDGTFDAAGPNLGTLPGGLVGLDAAVLHGDGNVYDDLVVGTTTGSIAFLLADGAGGFVTSDVVPVAPGLWIVDLQVADMDGDTIDDVVALDSGSGITVLFGDLAGSLTFGSSIYGGFPGSGDAKHVLVGDFDDAPGLDLAVVRVPLGPPALPVNVMIVTGDGSGGFGAIDGTVELPMSSSARPAVLHDPKEPRPGLLVTNGRLPVGERRSMQVIRTDPAGLPTATEAPPPAGDLLVLAAVDVNDDWRTDLVVLALDEAGLRLTVQVMFRSAP